jgi:hypothetical protein
MGGGVDGERAIALNLPKVSIIGDGLEVVVTKQTAKKYVNLSPLSFV